VLKGGSKFSATAKDEVLVLVTQAREWMGGHCRASLGQLKLAQLTYHT